MDDLYDTTSHLDAAAARMGIQDYGAARSEAFEIVSLALQAQAELAALPAWSPGDNLVFLLRSSADDLGAGASTFIDGLDAFDTDRMRSGALRMDSDGSQLSSAQRELDTLSARYGSAGC